MKHTLLIALGVFVLMPLCLCTARADIKSGATTKASESASANPRIVAAAREWFHRFQTGRIDRSQLNDQIKGELTAAMVAQEEGTLKSFGNPTSFKYIGSGPVGNATGYNFLVSFRDPRKIVEAIAFDGEGKIAGIDFQILVPTNH